MTETELKNMLSQIEHSLVKMYVEAITQECKKKIHELNNGKFEMNTKTAKYFNTIGKIEHYHDQYNILYLQCKTSTEPEDFKLLKKVRKIIYNEFSKMRP